MAPEKKASLANVVPLKLGEPEKLAPMKLARPKRAVPVDGSAVAASSSSRWLAEMVVQM